MPSAPLTARSPAPGDGHTHEAPAARDARRCAYKKVDAGRGCSYFVLMESEEKKGDRWVRLGDLAPHEAIVSEVSVRAQRRVSSGLPAASASDAVGHARVRSAISVAVPGL
jgi:hypothetical protein